MSKYQKYQHVERIGTTAVHGLLDGLCYIFPKIDGTNGVFSDEVIVKCGSRNREVSIESDNQGLSASMTMCKTTSPLWLYRLADNYGG